MGTIEIESFTISENHQVRKLKRAVLELDPAAPFELTAARVELHLARMAFNAVCALTPHREAVEAIDQIRLLAEIVCGASTTAPLEAAQGKTKAYNLAVEAVRMLGVGGPEQAVQLLVRAGASEEDAREDISAAHEAGVSAAFANPYEDKA